MSTGREEFIKCFGAVCQWNNYWERWNDMLHLFAIEIANAVDTVHRDPRNAEYGRIAVKYKRDEYERFADLFAIMTDTLEREPFQDFLGDMYMRLDMGSKAHGQCFTPFNVCRMVANLAMDESVIRSRLEEKGWISVNDCACGAGALLIAGAERLYEMGVNFQEKAYFVAGDIDTTVGLMCYIQLSMLGCAGRVRIGDTLTDPDTGDMLLGDGKPTTWYTPMLFMSEIWQGRVTARYMDLAISGFRKKRKEGEPRGDGYEQLSIL